MAIALLINMYCFTVVFAFISVVVLSEYQAINAKNVNKFGLLLVGIFAFALVFANLVFQISDVAIYIAVPLMFVVLISELFSKNPNSETLSKSVFALLYVTFPFSTLLILAYPNASFSLVYPLGVFIFLWANDSGAYIIGSLIGKHKMFERISPKKTWEGTIGGILVSILASIIYAQFYTKLALSEWLILAGMTAILGTFGDLYESMLKRRAGVKDSGKIMPGHGGLLDRFDSLLFAAPAAWVYLEVMEKL